MSLFVFVLLSCFAPDISMKATKRPAPHVVSTTQKQVDNCKETPLSPCLSETVVVENPLFAPVLVDLACGMDYDEQQVQIPARTRLSIEIELTTAPGHNPSCVMVGWKLTK